MKCFTSLNNHHFQVPHNTSTMQPIWLPQLLSVRYGLATMAIWWTWAEDEGRHNQFQMYGGPVPHGMVPIVTVSSGTHKRGAAHVQQQHKEGRGKANECFSMRSRFLIPSFLMALMNMPYLTHPWLRCRENSVKSVCKTYVPNTWP